jgi:hypothetical protein
LNLLSRKSLPGEHEKLPPLELWATATRRERQGTWTEQDVLSDFMTLLTLKGDHWDVSAAAILQTLNWHCLEGLLNTSWGLRFAAIFFPPSLPPS